MVLRSDPVEVWGTGEDVRDLIYIDDFLDGLLKAFHVDEPYLAINICSGDGIRVLDILKTAAKVDGFDTIDVRLDPSKPSTVPVRRLSAKLAEEKLGFKSKIDLDEGCKRTMAWYRKNPQPEDSK